MPEYEEKPQPMKRTYVDFVDGVDSENKKDELVNDNKIKRICQVVGTSGYDKTKR